MLCVFDFGCDVNSLFFLMYLSIFVHLHSLFAELVVLRKFVCVHLFCKFCFIGFIINVKPRFCLNAVRSV